MERFLEEVPALVVTILLLVIITILLITGVVPVNNPLIDIIVSIVIPFWFLQSAFKWQPGGTAPQPKEVSPQELEAAIRKQLTAYLTAPHTGSDTAVPTREKVA